MAITFTRIASTTLGSGQSNITFSSITQSYTDLILHVFCTTTGTPKATNFQYNGFSTNQYSRIGMYANGTVAEGYSNDNLPYALTGSGDTYPVAATVHIFDYTNTAQNKMTLVYSSDSGNGAVGTTVYRLKQNAAITDIVFTSNGGGVIGAGSIITIYGVLKA